MHGINGVVNGRACYINAYRQVWNVNGSVHGFSNKFEGKDEQHINTVYLIHYTSYKYYRHIW